MSASALQDFLRPLWRGVRHRREHLGRPAVQSRYLKFEPLEDRRVPAVITVTSLLDNTTSGDGLVTLREAVAGANANGSADTIQFAAGLSGIIDLSIVGDVVAGPSALLVNSPITIQGNSNGITIRRDSNAAEMRLFRVASGASLTIESLNLTGGVARGAVGVEGRGGAIYNEGLLQVLASTFHDNRAIAGSGATGLGGAIYNLGGSGTNGDVLIRNATLSGNKALNSAEGANNSSFGGDIYCRNGTLEIFNSTITNSTAAAGRSVYILAAGGSASAQIDSTIIGDQLPTGFTADLVALSETENDELSISGADNLIRRALNFANTWDVDPMLEPLQNNGGPTLTHALNPNSPAINSGSNPLSLTTDQRGASFSRAVGGTSDIGAFERQTPSGPALLGDYNRDEIVDAGDYVVWRKTLNTTVEMFAGADGSGNGMIDAADFEVWKQHFGETLILGAGSSNEAALSPAAVPLASIAATAPVNTAPAGSIETSLRTNLSASKSIAAALASVERPRGNSPRNLAVRVKGLTFQAQDRALLAMLADRALEKHSQSPAFGTAPQLRDSDAIDVAAIDESIEQFRAAMGRLPGRRR